MCRWQMHLAQWVSVGHQYVKGSVTSMQPLKCFTHSPFNGNCPGWEVNRQIYLVHEKDNLVSHEKLLCEWGRLLLISWWVESATVRCLSPYDFVHKFNDNSLLCTTCMLLITSSSIIVLRKSKWPDYITMIAFHAATRSQRWRPRGNRDNPLHLQLWLIQVLSYRFLF